MHLHVVGDSVPAGYGTDDAAWPERLPYYVPDLATDAVTVDAATGRTLGDCADRFDDDTLPAVGVTSSDEETVVIVHAGHNDAQLSGGDPRVPESRFRESATDLAAGLAASDRVDRYAFVGLVPLLRLDRPGAVSFGDEQPARGLAYDALLSASVDTHLRVVDGERDDDGPTDTGLPTLADWRVWTTDGVHPGPAGHVFIAQRIVEWFAARSSDR